MFSLYTNLCKLTKEISVSNKFNSCDNISDTLKDNNIDIQNSNFTRNKIGSRLVPQQCSLEQVFLLPLTSVASFVLLWPT